MNRIPKSELKKSTERMKSMPKVKITGTASTPPRVSSSMSRASGGIMGSGGKNVAPIYKMQGGMMGPAKIQGPQLPKNQGASIASKIKGVFADKPKYTSEQIVENKKLQAQIDAAAKKKK
jgi:hypothetical protein